MSAAKTIGELGKALGRVGLVGADLAAERVRPSAPSRALQDVPISAEHLTTEWLTAAL